MEMPIARFEKYFKLGDSGSCWPWLGGKVGKGYGRFNWSPASNYAHRASYMIYVGPIPDGMVIMHTCDRPECVNPLHLKPATQADNVRDMMVKGRAPFQIAPEKYIGLGGRLAASQKRANHSKAKLSEVDVSIIRYLISRGAFHTDIAKVFGMSKGAIADIANGRKWREKDGV